MKIRHLYLTALVGACLGTSLMAQTPISSGQIITTGIVGLTSHQTARLNVLNLNPVPTAVVTVANCNVELQFVDSQNKAQSSKIFYNLAPQTATSFDMPGVVAASTVAVVREEIRGVVTVNPPVPVATAFAPAACPVKVTLEIFDATSGITVALTSDTTTLGAVVPATAK